MAKGWRCRTYYNANPFIGLSLHETPVPPLMVPAKLPHIEFSVVQGLWIGSFISVGRNKKVVSDHLLFIGRMSDAGLGVPHISIPPSWWNLLTSLFAMSNSVWGSSSTKVACKNLLWGNEDCDMAATPFGPVPFSINLGCFDPFCLPTDIVVVWGTVYVGMSWSDILAACIDIAIFMATDIVLKILGEAAGPALKKLKAGASKLGEKIGSMVAKEVTEEAAEEAFEQGAEQAVKKSAFREAMESAGEKLKGVASDVGTVFKDLGDDIATKLKPATEALTERLNSMREAASELFQPLTDAISGEANGVYAKKAAKLKGMSEALGMTEKELAEAAEKGGYSKAVKELVENLDENMTEYLSQHESRLAGLNDYAEWGAKEIARDTDYLEKIGLKEYTEQLTTKALKESISDLDDALARVATQNLTWELLKKAGSLTFGKILWTNVICRGNLIGGGTSGGIFSFDGLGWTDYFKRSVTMDERAYKWAGEVSDAASAAEDYWYEAGDAIETVTDDDYWFGESKSTT